MPLLYITSSKKPIGFGVQKGDRLTACMCFFQDLLATFEKAAVVYQKNAIKCVQIFVSEMVAAGWD